MADVMELFGRAKEFVRTSPNWVTPIETGINVLDQADEDSRFQYRDLGFFPFLHLVHRVYVSFCLSSHSAG